MNNDKNKTHLIFLGDKNEIQLFSLNWRSAERF
jgi:hypothetical protein